MPIDPYDINWEELSYGELVVLQDLAEGEMKRRNFRGSARSDLMPEKQIAAIAFDLRTASQRLRAFCRDIKAAGKRDRAKAEEARRAPLFGEPIDDEEK